MIDVINIQNPTDAKMNRSKYLEYFIDFFCFNFRIPPFYYDSLNNYNGYDNGKETRN